VDDILFCINFFGGLECVVHSFAYVTHFCIFERCLDSNPESCSSKHRHATNLVLNHPSPYFNFYFYFLWAGVCCPLHCLCSPFFVFLRDVWLRTQIAALASRQATNLATHLPRWQEEKLLLYLPWGLSNCSREKLPLSTQKKLEPYSFGVYSINKTGGRRKIYGKLILYLLSTFSTPPPPLKSLL
jgi:hypothetical protein